MDPEMVKNLVRQNLDLSLRVTLRIYKPPNWTGFTVHPEGSVTCPDFIGSLCHHEVESRYPFDSPWYPEQDPDGTVHGSMLDPSVFIVRKGFS